jgi:hypothetical protein
MRSAADSEQLPVCYIQRLERVHGCFKKLGCCFKSVYFLL